jgi:hypothetical protein
MGLIRICFKSCREILFMTASAVAAGMTLRGNFGVGHRDVRGASGLVPGSVLNHLI